MGGGMVASDLPSPSSRCACPDAEAGANPLSCSRWADSELGKRCRGCTGTTGRLGAAGGVLRDTAGGTVPSVAPCACRRARSVGVWATANSCSPPALPARLPGAYCIQSTPLAVGVRAPVPATGVPPGMGRGESCMTPAPTFARDGMRTLRSNPDAGAAAAPALLRDATDTCCDVAENGARRPMMALLLPPPPMAGGAIDRLAGTAAAPAVVWVTADGWNCCKPANKD